VLRIRRPNAERPYRTWGYPVVPAVFLAFYVFLLFTRERADERRCAAKYGELWAEYERKVPKRIIPWVY
jgi:delta14-sterol reductase